MTVLAGKVVAVVGASTGIGRATALACARAGAVVVAGARSAERAVAVADEARREGAPEAIGFTVDVTRAETVDAFVEAARTLLGRLDGAVNNAGVEGALKPLHACSDRDYAEVMDTNTRGVFVAMRAEIRAMAAAGGGSIVNVGSVGSFTGLVGQSVYAASKHAVWALTRSAAAEYAERGVRVNMIAPGGTETPMLHRVLKDDPAAWSAAAAAHPIGRFGSPAECAAAIVWLLSDAASYVCGQSIGVDGGYSATIGFAPVATAALASTLPPGRD